MRIWLLRYSLFLYQRLGARLAHSLHPARHNEHRLPAVLSVEELRSLLARVKTFYNHVYLSTVYSCGLRLHDNAASRISFISQVSSSHY
jgi:hypothetical protein